MKVVGIVCEYNPFHNGHEYHIKKVRELYPDCNIVLILGGDFTQRGDVSLIDKWKKCEIALNYVDLVVELPFVFASQSADLFCKGATDILKALGVDAFVFGSECDDLCKFERIALVQNSNEYNRTVKKYIDEGYNYPTSLSKALVDLCGETIDSPNDLLGLGYVKGLLGSGIEIKTIKRTNDYLDLELNGKITSASSIREALKRGEDIREYVPSLSYSYLNNVKFIDDYFDLIKYKIISEDISVYQSVDEGIENRIKRVIGECYCLDDLVNSVKSKRYTYNRIRRMLVHILIGFTKEEANSLETKYIRVLGFNKRGRNFLNGIKKNCPLPIITNFIKDNKMLEIEARVSAIYNLKKKDDPLSEQRHKPIIH